MQNSFHKKIFTLTSFLMSIWFVVSNLILIIKAFRSKDISRHFGEKIMLVTTAMNGCSYCAWFHAKVAATSGMKDEEIKNMLDLQFQTSSTEYEIPALLFTQHYAETNKNPEKKMIDILTNFYGDETSRNIILYIEVMFIGNLTGNTFDAFISRIKGIKATDSNVIFEFVFFVLLLPIMIPVLLLKNKN